MKNYHALVVEDDDRIMEQFDSELFSLGHAYERAASQGEAQQKLETHTFDYVLLDMHIPARQGRGGASTEYGLHLLKHIRQMKSPTALPVIIVTGKGDACVDLMTELNSYGPNEFVAKPWPTDKGRTLGAVIKGVLRQNAEGHAVHAERNPVMQKTKFAGGTVVYWPERVEILGRVIAEESHRSNFWIVLQHLRQKCNDGRFKAFSGSVLAEQFKGKSATQNTVSSCVGKLRERITELLAEAGVEAGEEDVILSGGAGYRFKEWIKIEERDEENMPDSAGEGTESVQAESKVETGTSGNAPLSDRQFWVIDQIRSGVKLQRADLQKQFAVTAKTAKRDMADLLKRGLIVFVRTPRPGHYAMGKR